MVSRIRTFAVVAALGLAGLATSGIAYANSDCSAAAVACPAGAVVNVANAASDCSAAAAACPASAASVVNVANTKSDCATACEAAGKSCDGEKVASAKSDCATACSSEKAASVVNVANEKSGCASACAASPEIIASAAAAEKIDGLGGGDASSSKHYTLGSKVADVTLPHAQSGNDVSLSSLAGEKATVLIFWNQSCPWVENSANAAADKIFAFANSHKDHGVNVVLVDAGVENSAEVIIEYAKSREGMTMPLLLNRDSSLAAAFNASYTPEAFILNGDMELVYHGAFMARQGDSWTYPAEAAVRNIVNNEPVAVPTASGRGCSIKWAPGSRP